MTVEEAQEVVRLSHEAAREVIRSATTPPMAATTLTAVEASPADITDEL